jgi:hypothetical protein
MSNTGYTKSGSVDLRKLPKITIRPLMQHRADGMAHQLLHCDTGLTQEDAGPPLLELDSNLTGRRRLETILHEALHLACPFMPEHTVLKTARYQAMIAWHMGYDLQVHKETDD